MPSSRCVVLLPALSSLEIEYAYEPSATRLPESSVASHVKSFASPFHVNVFTTAFLSLTIVAVHRSSLEDFCVTGSASRTLSPFGENTRYGAEISMEGYFVSIVKSGACEREALLVYERHVERGVVRAVWAAFAGRRFPRRDRRCRSTRSMRRNFAVAGNCLDDGAA